MRCVMKCHVLSWGAAIRRECRPGSCCRFALRAAGLAGMRAPECAHCFARIARGRPRAIRAVCAPDCAHTRGKRRAPVSPRFPTWVLPSLRSPESKRRPRKPPLCLHSITFPPVSSPGRADRREIPPHPASPPAGDRGISWNRPPVSPPACGRDGGGPLSRLAKSSPRRTAAAPSPGLSPGGGEEIHGTAPPDAPLPLPSECGPAAAKRRRRPAHCCIRATVMGDFLPQPNWPLLALALYGAPFMVGFRLG